MARNRYVQDYRLVEYVDERGRFRTEKEYIGAAYEYASDADAVTRGRRLALCVCAVGWLCFFGALIPNSAAMHTIYVSLPFIFAALPLGILTDALLSAPKPGRKMERRQAERLSNRYPPAALFTALLSGVSIPGACAALWRSGTAAAGDAVFLSCAAALTACGVILFIKRRSFDTRKA